jgi:hypothetical protein
MGNEFSRYRASPNLWKQAFLKEKQENYQVGTKRDSRMKRQGLREID